jgi:L-lactate dehydrogenase complex protein LldG
MVESDPGGQTVTARDEVLGRIRTALRRDGGASAAAPPAGGALPREYRTSGSLSPGERLDLLAQRLAGYRAHVRRCSPGELTAVAAQALTQRGARRAVVPPGLETTGLDLDALGGLSGTELITDTGLSPAELDRMDAVITGAAAAIAETGTIILDGSPGQGRRAVSLVPDYHLCVIHAAQAVDLVPEALSRLTAHRPLTWISGPSATSDIELDRVEGVHGPRTLEVILVSP